MSIVNCRFFNGYKPCGKSDHCDESCESKSIPSSRLLIVHLGALGAVLRSTSLLAAIHRKFPRCHLTWVTSRPADQVLRHNPFIDTILTTDAQDLRALSIREFDIAFVIDKSAEATAIAQLARVDYTFGFQVDPRSGAVVPATPAANELWQIGLSNQKKFFENQKTEIQLTHEALELGSYHRDEYILTMTAAERSLADSRRQIWSGSARDQWVVGINTGAAPTIPYKKLSVQVHRQLIRELLKIDGLHLVLLGGKEDTLRNQHIAAGFRVSQSPTENGIRDGIASLSACDLVVTGDSFGMHLAIGLKKWVVAWFGPTCQQEIELYSRGEKIQSKAACSPCWKRQCDKNPLCDEQVSLAEMRSAVERGIAALRVRPGAQGHPQFDAKAAVYEPSL